MTTRLGSNDYSHSLCPWNTKNINISTMKCPRILQSKVAPPVAPPGVIALRVGAEPAPPGAPPNRDDMISPNGLAACVRGGGMAKYTVAISFKACEIESRAVNK